MPSPNRIVIHDCIHDMTIAYRNGARALRNEIPFFCNPHREDSQDHCDWNHGHDNDAAREHLRFGIDLIEVPAEGKTFEDDPDVLRNSIGDVDEGWARTARSKLPANLPSEKVDQAS